MAVQFVLGRSGTGKTSYCVRAIVDALLEPSEQPLLFLVPEQATYQAERAILGDPRIKGYHRLHILSFDRLQFLLLGKSTARPAISRIGRQMIVHKILRDNLDKLQIFGSSALMPGFAREMAATITELHQYAKSPEDIDGLLDYLEAGGRRPEDGGKIVPVPASGRRVRTTHHHSARQESVREGSQTHSFAFGNPDTHPTDASSRLSALKFADIALVFRRYTEALQDKFIDPDAQITIACKAVAKSPIIKGARLWVDGFASFTGGEMALLIEVLRAVDQAYVALCVDPADCASSGGSLKAEGLGDGLVRGGGVCRAHTPMKHKARMASPQSSHPQASLEAATRDNPSARPGLFEPTARTYRDMLDRLGEAKVKVAAPLVLNHVGRFARCPGLAHVEQNVFRLGVGRAKAGGDIRLVAAPSLRLEIQFVGRQILSLVRDQGYRYCDIAVVASDLGHYEQYVRAYFEDYGIPFFIDKRKPLSQHPVIELVCAALQAVIGGLARADLFAYLKTDLAPVASSDVDALENYCLAFGVDGRDWVSGEPWQFKEAEDEQFDEDDINRIRDQAVGPLLKLRAALCPDGDLEKKVTASEFTRVIFAFLDRLQVRRTVSRWIAEAHRSDDPATADEHRQFFDTFVDIFDALVEIFDGQEMTVQDYFGLLASAFAQMTLAFIPPKLDQVLVGSIERSRHPNLKAIFLLGATQKQFPIPMANSGVLADEDRDAAEAAEFQLAPSSTQSLLDRQYLAYIAFTRPSKFMCISYPCVDEKGSPIMRSHFIDELQSLFEDVAEEFIADNLLTLQEVQSNPELGELLCCRLGRDTGSMAVPAVSTTGILPVDVPDMHGRDAHDTHGQDAHATHGQDARATSDDGLAALLRAMQTDAEYTEMSRQIISALAYENRAHLEPSVAKQLFGRHLRGSATRLGTFAACPYKHFVRYILGLKPRREFKLEPLDLGLFYHRILDALQKRLVVEREDIAAVEQDRLLQLLHDETTKLAELDPFISQFTHRSAHNAFIIASASNILEEFVLGVSQMVRAGSFRPYLSEAAFGCPPEVSGRLGRFELPLADGCVLSLDGKIDRLDVAEIDGRKVALILDYKRTHHSANFNWCDFYHGLDVQLAIYMLAVHHAGAGVAGDIAGALYVPIETTPATATLAELSEDEPRKFPYKARGIINGAYCSYLDANASGQSEYYNYYVKKDGDPYGRYAATNILRPEHFKRLLDWSRENILRLATDILSGRIEARPYHRGTERACGFCEFMGVCHFDWQINEYSFLRSVGKTDLMAQLDNV